MNKKQYRLTVNEEQLRMIADCVEDCSRLASGQMEIWNTTSRVVQDFIGLKDELNRLQPFVTPGLPKGASYGWDGGHCPYEPQKEFIRKSYALYREIRHFMTVEDGIENVYSSPTLSCGEPFPIIEKIQ